MVFALQSNCDSSRINLIHKLKIYTQVDVYGGCARLFKESSKLPRCNRDSKCKRVMSEYKFVISIENSLCDEYLTEKYFENGLKNGLVPIVMIPPKFEARNKNLVPGSYINIYHFKSIESLAKHLEYLNKNATAYNEYFEWKQKYEIKPGEHRACLLCKKLWDMEKKRKISIPKKRIDLSKFWSADDCVKSTDLEYFGIN